ncbi:Uncharacterized protein SCG7109_AJ_00090 [Chlamydiales bacterium SCGC AG-110-M15]|nr:Uncharacterized protein SCG7109_AJ_00090 [Chlamydiales bacterium SCGC AG-110-M15]
MSKIIHVGKLHLPKQRKSSYAILRETDEGELQWYIENGTGENATDIKEKTVSEAIRSAKRRWRDAAFNPLHCGTRFELPERDEHGAKALFCQMVQSQRVNNGIYFDEQINQQCIVNNISTEAIALMKRWEKEGKL